MTELGKVRGKLENDISQTVQKIMLYVSYYYYNFTTKIIETSLHNIHTNFEIRISC